MKVAVLTTSYPRGPDDPSGRFVADAVEHLREAGVQMEVLRFRDFGLTGHGGVVANARLRPWRLPPMLAAMALAARRADADLVHAHWLPAGAVAALADKPFVVTLHGTDVELARRAGPVARVVLRRAAAVIAVSSALADAARVLGATAVHVVPNGVDIPATVEPEAEPPFVLYAGRLSPEKGIEELVAAADGLPLVVVGDGPLRNRVPQARGFVAREELSCLYGRAAVVACPSRREGFGLAAAEAMAHGRPVVASAVGGLLDLVADGETGLLVPPRDPAALRAALSRLLADPDLRGRLGDEARRRVSERCSWDRVTAATLAVYRAALLRRSPSASRRTA